MSAIRRSFALLALPALLILGLGVKAQFGGPKFLKVSASAPKSIAAGKAGTVVLAVTIDAPYHIQGNPAKTDYIPTELEAGPLKGFKVEKAVYPKPMIASLGGDKLPVYEGKIQIKIDVTAEKTLKPGKYVLPITLKYQGCDDQKCFPPTTIATKTTLVVTSGAK